MADMVQVSDVHKTFVMPDGVTVNALRGTSMTVKPQEFVCILGPSGCGKSTLLNLLAGLDTFEDGHIYLDEKPLAQASRWVRIGYVFQEPRLLPWLTIRQNLHLVISSSTIPRSEWRSLIQENLNLVGLAGFEDRYPHQLSGGMQQRASIARALAIQPDLLLMDEPFSSLDEITARRMRREMLQLWEATRKTVIFVTHNAFEACFLADRIILMTPRPGRVYREVTVDLPRPRDYDDPNLFAFNTAVVKEFLRLIGEE